MGAFQRIEIKNLPGGRFYETKDGTISVKKRSRMHYGYVVKSKEPLNKYVGHVYHHCSKEEVRDFIEKEYYGQQALKLN
jgi:ABC-type metal ion transport system substrate-binding protein